MFDLCAPTLLTLAGHLVRDRTAVEDLVQATFLDAIEHPDRFDPERPLIPWLTGMLINHIRHERRRAARSTEAERLPPRRAEAPDREAEARELAEIVVSSLERLPAIYSEVLQLRLVQGLEPAQIAETLGRPQETVKTQLTRGLERLRRDLPTGVSPGLAALLAGTAGAGRARAAVRAFATSRPRRPTRRDPSAAQSATKSARVSSDVDASVTPTTASRAAHRAREWLRAWGFAAAAVVVAIILGWSLVPRGASDLGRRPDPLQGRAMTDAERASAAAEPTTGIERESVARIAVPGGGAREVVEVVVRWQRDGTPAVNVTVSLRPAADDSWLRERRERTDEDGTARFALLDLPSDAEEWRIRTDRGEPPTVVPRSDGKGPTRPVEIELPAGIDVSGIVLDERGQPLAGARLWFVPPSVGIDEGCEVGVADELGQFDLHDIPPRAAIGASSDGFASTRCVVLGDQSISRVTLRSPARAPTIRGTVRGPDGSPVAGAAVLVGWAVSPGEPPLPAPWRTHTAADGGFVCRNQWRGAVVPIWVRAPGYAVQRFQTPRLPGGTEHVLDVRLEPGATVGGRVMRRDGSAVANARLELRQGSVEPPAGYVFDGPNWARITSATDAEGHFEVRYLHAGDTELRVDATDGARLRERRTVRDGDLVAWNVVLGRGASLRGRLVDSTGAPLADWAVRTERIVGKDSERGEFIAEVRSRDNGHFEVPRCEEARRYRLLLHQSNAVIGNGSMGRIVTAHDDVEHLIRLEDAEVASGYMSLSMRGPDGSPLRKIRLDLLRPARDGSLFQIVWDGSSLTGRYRVGPLHAGRYLVTATHSDLGSIPLGAWSVGLGADVEVDLGEPAWRTPGKLRIRLFAATGGPVTERSIPVVGDGFDAPLWMQLVSGRGQLLVQPGTYLVSYYGNEGAPLCERFDVQPGAVASRDLHLATGEKRHFRVVGVQADATSLHFEWFHEGRKVAAYARVFHTGVGGVESVVLRPGSYRVVTRDALGREAVTAFEVPEGSGAGGRTIELRAPSGD